jgi:hypothetical protein
MSEEKKIFVDEDWKNQVAAEKQAAQRQAPHQPGEPASAAAVGSQAIPATFDLLVTSFVTEAMVALGQIAHPISGKQQFDPAAARFAIDMLDVIAEKTKGNLTSDEERGLEQVIHQLRMAFVAVSSQHSTKAPKDASLSPTASG